jgi:predicted amidohydrolase
MKKKRIKLKKKTSSFPVRICCVQYRLRKIKSFDDFANQVEFFIDVAEDYNSDFVLFPELLTTQLISTMKEKKPKSAVKALTELTPKYVSLFKRLAKRYKINILAGSHFTNGKINVYNTAYLFRRDGTFETQRKIHVTPTERKYWGISPGKKITTFDTDCGRIAILNCYDSEFPELARIVTLKGAKILFVPYSTDDRHGFIRILRCVQARAIENQVYVATAGIVGNLPHVKNMDDIRYAQSGIYTPSDFPFPRDGIAGECEANVETVVIADVDLEVLKRNRKSGTVKQLMDMRKDLYETRIK